MQDTRNIHNANVLAQAMKAQDIATRAEILHAELSFLLSLEPEKVLEDIEPIEFMQLVSIQSVLRKLAKKTMLKKFSEELQ